jgi:hypothetical protein
LSRRTYAAAARAMLAAIKDQAADTLLARGGKYKVGRRPSPSP